MSILDYNPCNKIEMANMRRNKTARRDKKEGGDRNKKDRRNKTEGGKRKGTRKLSHGAKTWQQHVMSVYKEMKAKDPNVKLGAAMKEAAARKRKGEL